MATLEGTKPRFFDVDGIVLSYDLDEGEIGKMTLMQVQHFVATVVGFQKWADLIKAPGPQLELAKLMFKKLMFDDSQHFDLFSWELYLRKNKLEDADDDFKLEVFKRTFGKEFMTVADDPPNNSALKPQERQKALDKINSFFNGEFKRLKNSAFPNVAKFGIGYTSNAFGVYPIEKGSSKDAFTILKHNPGDDIGRGELAAFGMNTIYFSDITTKVVHRLLGDTIHNLIRDKTALIPFMPDEVLHEIAFEALDRRAESDKSIAKKDYHAVFHKDEVSMDEFTSIINKHYGDLGRFVNQEIKVLDAAMQELNKRGMTTIKRLWRHKDESKFWGWDGTHVMGFAIPDLQANYEKLYTSLPNMLEAALKNLFGSNASKYHHRGEYSVVVKLSSDKGEHNKFYDYVLDNNKPFQVRCIDKKTYEQIKDLPDVRLWGSGWSRADFAKGTPLFDSLLVLLYRGICSHNKFKEERLSQLECDLVR